MKLLAELIGVCSANPDLSIAALLERYRDTREAGVRFWSGWPSGGWRYRKKNISLNKSLPTSLLTCVGAMTCENICWRRCCCGYAARAQH